jgi:hypothetical protein
MKNTINLSLFAALYLFSTMVFAEGVPLSKSPEGAKVYIISPTDGETVGTEVLVKFGLQGMGVAPAGTDKENTGHHHLLIDSDKLPDLDKPMGSDVMHFGGGQTEKLIKLEKGKHTLQMILGNYMHVPHNPPVVSEKITINVE